MSQFKTISPIDWARVARPQDDGYDSTVLAGLQPTWTKQSPSSLDVTLCGGRVKVGPCRINMSMGDNCVPVELSGGDYDPPARFHNWTHSLTRYLSGWSAGYRMLQNFLDEFWPYNDTQLSATSLGCTSGHHIFSEHLPIHAVYVTINNAMGCAQGIYHEVAHSRLEVMGIGIEHHDGRLLGNAPDELYDSSVRFDKKRPMSAVLHGVYAWLMFTENDYQNYQVYADYAQSWPWLTIHNLPKIEKGVQELERYAHWTAEGDKFADGLFDWAESLLMRTHRLAIQVLPEDQYKQYTGVYSRHA